MFASRNGHIETVKLLLELRGRHTLMIQNGNTSLGYYEADVNMQNKNGCTSLMIASEVKRTEIIKCLLCHGADITIKDNRGHSAINYAIKNKHTELETFLSAYNKYDHLPIKSSIKTAQCSTHVHVQHNECATIIRRPDQTHAFNSPNIAAPTFTKPSTETDRSATFKQYGHSECDYLMSLTSTQNIEHDIISIPRSGQENSFNNIPNTCRAPSCNQSMRHKEANQGSLRLIEFRHVGTVIKNTTGHSTQNSKRYHDPQIMTTSNPIAYQSPMNNSGTMSCFEVSDSSSPFHSLPRSLITKPSPRHYGYHSSLQTWSHTKSSSPCTQRTMLPSNKTWFANSQLTKSLSRFTQESGFYESSSHNSGIVSSLSHIAAPQSCSNSKTQMVQNTPWQPSMKDNSICQNSVFTQNSELILIITLASS